MTDDNLFPDDDTAEVNIQQATPPRTSRQEVVKVIFRRAWTDVEPKIVAGFVGGTVASAIIAEAAHIGYPLDPGAASLLTALLSFLGGYIKHSTARQVFEGSTNN